MLTNDEKNTYTDVNSGPERLSADEAMLLLTQKRFSELSGRLSHMADVDIAELIDETDEEYRTRLFRLLQKEAAAEVFVLLSGEDKERLIKSFSDRELSSMLLELYLDDTVDIIEEMPAVIVKRIIKSSTPENRDMINQLLRYPKDSAGTVMTTEYVRFRADMTVGEALSHIRRVAIDKETIYTCYVTDAQRRLIGIVTAKDLLICSETVVLSDIMERDVIFAYTTDDKEEVAATLDKYGFLALPVVDKEKRLVGIVTVDDAIDVLRDAVEEDIAKITGMTPSEEPYLKRSVFSLFLSRIPWLLLLMVSATFSSTILGGFEAALPSVLLLFVPMLMDTGGNSGSQASVTVIRGISLGELRFSDVLSALFKEVRVGILCAGALGAVAFLKVMLVDRLIMANSEVTVTVALIVALTLALTVIISKTVGCTLPLLAHKIGLDPAVMASPFITTVVDALALLVYFAVSAALLSAV